MKRLIVSIVFFIFSLSVTWFTVHATELTACEALHEADQKYIHAAALFHRMKVEGLFERKRHELNLPVPM